MKNTIPRSLHFDCQVTGIILLGVGYGWIGGTFAQPFLPFLPGGLIDLVHELPWIILLAFALPFFRSLAQLQGKMKSHQTLSGKGITVFAVLSILLSLVMIGIGLSNPDPNAFGVHSIEDWMPVIVLNAGTLIWLTTLFF